MTFRVFRWVHVYLATASLGLMVLLAVSGFVLNHADWFAGPVAEESTVQLGAGDLADRLTVVEALRRAGCSGEVRDYRGDEQEIRVVFVRPGGRDDATVELASGQADLVRERSGLTGWLMDVHRGKGTSWAWRLVLDAGAVLLVVGSISGGVIVLSNHSRRVGALVAAGLVVLAMAGVLVWG